MGLGAGLAMGQQLMNAMRPDQAATTAPAPNGAAGAATKFCIACGKSIARAAKFCPECGADQQ